jgi:hypothetical protein
MKERAKPSIIFLFIGGLLLFIAYLLRPSSPQADGFISSALSNIAFVLLTVTILDLLWGLLGGEPISKSLSDLRQSLHLFDNNLQQYINLLGDSRTTGVVRLLTISGDFGSPGDWMQRLKSAQQEIDLMGYNLHVWTKGDNFEEEVLKLVQKGTKVRILIMDENNPSFDSFLNVTQLQTISTAFVKSELQQARKVFEQIDQKIHAMNVKPSGSFELRTVQKGLIICHMCRTDAEMVVINYLFSEIASRSPLMLIQGREAKMFQMYQKEFDQIWKLNEPIIASQPQVLP